VAIGDQTNAGYIQVYDENLSLIKSFQAHTNQIVRIRQSPFGQRLVATGSWDTTINIWNASTSSNGDCNWTLVQTYRNHNNYVYALEFINEDTLASGAFDSTIQIWSLTTGQTLKTINVGIDVWSLQMLSNGTHLAAGLLNGNISVYNISTGSLVINLKGHAYTVVDLALINEDLLASSSVDATIRVWNLTSNECKFILTGHTAQVNGLKLISLDILASGSFDTNIKLWNVTSGRAIRTLTGHMAYVYHGVDLFDSQTLISGAYDQTIKTWNIRTGQCLNTITTNGGIFRSLAVLYVEATASTQSYSSINFSKTSLFSLNTKLNANMESFLSPFFMRFIILLPLNRVGFKMHFKRVWIKIL
jgi:hypothetical protein